MSGNFFAGCDGYIVMLDGQAVAAEYTPDAIIRYLSEHFVLYDNDIAAIRAWCFAADLGDRMDYVDYRGYLFVIECQLI